MMQAGGRPAYKIEHSGRPILLESGLGFEPGFSAGFAVMDASSAEFRGEWTHEFGDRRIVPDHYRELNVNLKHESGKVLRLTFHAYNEGAAFRYTFPIQDQREFTFTGERSEFRFPEGTFAYEAHGTEGPYRRARTGEIRPFCERPLTLEYAHGLLACLTEAGTEVYPRTLLSGLHGVPGALVTALGGPADGRENAPLVDGRVEVSPPFSSTWRLFVVGEKPGDLLERNYLVLNLSRPQALTDTSWIKPGKAMRDVTLSTEGGKAVIDFAARHNLQYIGFDWGWYGTEDPETGDATKVNVDPRRVRHTPSHPGLDLHEVIRYARGKNVGVLLYVDRWQIKKQRDILFPLYRRWGVSGVKIGFIDAGPQEETRWMMETVRKAAEHRLVLDIHDQMRATGYGRTYPNLLTVEGIRGNEQMPTPDTTPRFHSLDTLRGRETIRFAI
jgi:alpha-glucosidase